MSSSRVPPQDLDAERSVLGSIFLDPVRLDDVSGILRPDAFYLDAHRKIYESIVALRVRGVPIISDAVFDDLVRRGLTADATADLLIACQEAVPHGVHAEYYAGRIAEQARRRAMIYCCTDGIKAAYSPQDDVNEAAAALESSVHQILQVDGQDGPKPLRDALFAVSDQIDSETPVGVMSGYAQLDAATLGFPIKGLSVLAARPSVGKTALVGSIAANVAHNGDGVFFASLEQSKEQIALRMIAAETTIDATKIRGRTVDWRERERIVDAINTLGQLNIWIEDRNPQTIQQLAARTRLLVRKHGIRLLVVDYLQRVDGSDKRGNREQQVAEVTAGLKNVAKDLNIAVLAVASMNRQVDLRESKRPKMSDIRESGSIESDADLILFLDRPGMRDTEADRSEAVLIVSKNRDGAVCDVPLRFDGTTMRFESVCQADGSAWAW